MSYMSIVLKQNPSIKAVVLAAFPSYRKLKVTFSVFNGGIHINSYWDGGSKDEYRIVELATIRSHGSPSSSHPYFDVARHGLAYAEDESISVDRVGNVTLKRLPSGFCIVSAGTFCGKPATAHLYVHPDNMPRLLPDAV